MADAWQRRCRRRSVLPAHARLVHNLPANRVLVPCAKRFGYRRRGSGTRGAGQAVLHAHCRSDLWGRLRDFAAGDLGGHRSPAVCLVDDGRRLADGAAGVRRPPGERLGVAVLRDRPGAVDFARRVFGADVARAPCLHLSVSTQQARRHTFRRDDGYQRWRGGASCDRSGWASAADQLGCTDRPPHDRRRGDSAVFRTKPPVRDCVGTSRGDGNCCCGSSRPRAQPSQIASC